MHCCIACQYWRMLWVCLDQGFPSLLIHSVSIHVHVCEGWGEPPLLPPTSTPNNNEKSMFNGTFLAVFSPPYDQTFSSWVVAIKFQADLTSLDGHTHTHGTPTQLCLSWQSLLILHLLHRAKTHPCFHVEDICLTAGSTLRLEATIHQSPALIHTSEGEVHTWRWKFATNHWSCPRSWKT